MVLQRRLDQAGKDEGAPQTGKGRAGGPIGGSTLHYEMGSPHRKIYCEVHGEAQGPLDLTLCYSQLSTVLRPR